MLSMQHAGNVQDVCTCSTVTLLYSAQAADQAARLAQMVMPSDQIGHDQGGWQSHSITMICHDQGDRQNHHHP